MSTFAQNLLSAGAVRAKADELFALAADEALEHWRLDLDALGPCADFVASTIRRRYPDLDAPFHARWRHFILAGRDLWAELASAQAFKDNDARARAAFDLVITSVLLDAGAGARWSYRDSATGIEVKRSEGLALASLRFFAQGGFSGDPAQNLRADAQSLMRISAAELGYALQASADNPLPGLEGRAALLNRLGARIEARRDPFASADAPRPGGLHDFLKARAANGVLPAPQILQVLLEEFGPIWENRPTLDGVALGDCWPLPQHGYAPLHKLSQWLAYSLIEPLEQAGVRIIDIDGLTGLAEYRNGGLFVDMGVLVPRNPGALAESYDVSDPFVVIWRSLTVALLDRIAPLVRERLGVGREAFPLARVLEGGSWAAGRAIAREKRADGGPPFIIHSDGTVF